MLGAAVRMPCMATEREHAPLSTEVSPLETEVDPQASGRCDSAAAPAQPELTAPHERLATGHRLSDRYRIERELGEGGMGVVYLVTDEQVAGETFAIKLLKESLDPEALSLLREEVRKTRKLSHPNIVDVHSVNVDGTKLYVLMEYLEGKSLNALLDEEFGRGMSFSHAWPIIEDVGAALGYAHDHNVIHSDLKPANVFLTTLGKTKLLDFGIARVSRGPLLHKRSGLLALTPAYASCEMLEGEEADPRDDIYSFACVIYEIFCGKRPFGELTALEACEAGSQVPPIEMLTRGQNAALAKALAFDREGRTSSVEKLLEGLAPDKKPRARPMAVLGGTIIAASAALGLTYLLLDKLWISRHPVVVQSASPDAQPAASPASDTGATFNPPPHSIAVLPFVNMSGDKDQEYFSDGLSEELLNSLSRINELQVAGRTSSFYFKGEHADLATIAHKLNVGAVLEGSVRRSGHAVRINTQLINAVTGFQLWSQTYDRDLGEVLKLQTEIANAVASALTATLLGDVSAKIELGGTHNPTAFDAYLRAFQAHMQQYDVNDESRSIAAYTEAIRLDPSYALAFAGRALSLALYAETWATGSAVRETLERAQSDARKALALAPELPESHLALAIALEDSLEFVGASKEYERSLALAPNHARVLRNYAAFAALMGQTDLGIKAGRRAFGLDPLNAHQYLGIVLLASRRYADAIAALAEAVALDPKDSDIAFLGRAYYLLGDFQGARSSCEKKAESEYAQLCLALAYYRLGQHPDAEAMLAKLRDSMGDTRAFQYAEIYAQWGRPTQALKSLDTAIQLRSPSLEWMKTDALLDPLRQEPRFQALMRELKFPN
jgi:serine/threonine protein kinase/tetratricopeptide (TPR) repeat protein